MTEQNPSSEEVSPLEKVAQSVESASASLATTTAELRDERYWRKRSRRRERIDRIVIAILLLVVLWQSHNNGATSSLIKECVTAPKHPSKPGHENCFERSQKNSSNAISILISEDDRLRQLRTQELLEAINNHQPIVLFEPPNTTIPSPTTTTTKP